MNLDRLRELAGHLRDAVRQLGELARTPREQFLADSRAVNSAKYLLIVAAETALDVCNHLAARLGARSPEDYADCMTILAEIGVIDLDARLAVTAARLSLDTKLPMADNVVLATAGLYSGTLWTQDADFKRVPGVRYRPRKS